MAKIKYFPYTEWECYQNGMYKTVTADEMQRMVEDAKRLLSSTDELKQAMVDAITKWKKSASSNIADGLNNHRPWLGQSACCIALGCTEDSVRKAWVCLSAETQAAANKVADEVFRSFLVVGDYVQPFLPGF